MWIFLKKIGWRLAGLYFWFHFIAWLIGYSNELVSYEKSAFQFFGILLESIGATPVNSKTLQSIVKIGWVLFIVEFKPLLFLGFILYIIVFPISFTFFVSSKLINLYKYFTSKKNSAIESVISTEDSQESSKETTKGFPTLSVFCFLLFAWFLVFGDAISLRVSSIGTLLSGAIFFVLLFRLFIKTKPPSEEKYSLFTWIEYPTKIAKEVHLNSLKKEGNKNSSSTLSFLNYSQNLLKFISKFIESKQSSEKIAFLVLLEFIVNLVLVASCAVLFWGLVIKSVNPSKFDLITCLMASLSYFLPGMDSPDIQSSIPFWIKVSNSITSWILFVIYISVAGNITPDKQRAYTKQLSVAQSTYKKTLLYLKSEETILTNQLEKENQPKLLDE